MMIIGESLVSGVTAYSPWFEAFGPGATFACAMLAMTAPGTTELTIVVQTKNLLEVDEDATNLTPIGIGSWVVGAVGIDSATYEGFLELVRFKYSVASARGHDVVHFQLLPPAWRDDCSVCRVEEYLERAQQRLSY